MTGNAPSPLILFCDMAIGGRTMRTTILAYAIAFMGLIMIGGGGVGPFPIGRNNGSASVEILRDGIRNDIWRHCHGWPCAGLAPATRDKRPRLEDRLTREANPDQPELWCRALGCTADTHTGAPFALITSCWSKFGVADSLVLDARTATTCDEEKRRKKPRPIC